MAVRWEEDFVSFGGETAQPLHKVEMIVSAVDNSQACTFACVCACLCMCISLHACGSTLKMYQRQNG